MAIVGLVMGSVLGFFGGIAGWLIWDLSVLSAFSLYLFVSLTMTAMTIVLGFMRKTDTDCHARAEAY